MRRVPNEWRAKLAVALCAVALVVAAAYSAQLRLAGGTREGFSHQGEGGTLVLLDLTDPLTTQQKSALQRRMAELVTTLNVHQRLELWSLADYPEGPLRRHFSRAVPERHAGWLTGNPRIIQQRFDSLLTRPWLRLADGLATTAEGSPTTPLIEALQELGELPLLHGAGPHTLIVVSDLIQNSGTASAYSDPVAHDQEIARSWPKTRLDSLDVRVWYLTRRRDQQYLGGSHRHRWRTYIVACGAASVVLEPL